MPEKNPPRLSREWTKPRLEKIGTVRDIAQGPAPLNQANNDKRS